MARPVVAVPAAGAAIWARYERAVKARVPRMAVARGCPNGLHRERLGDGRAADAMARAIIWAHAQAAVGTAVARLTVAHGSATNLVAFTATQAAVEAAAQGAVGAAIACSTAALAVEARALARAVGSACP